MKKQMVLGFFEHFAEDLLKIHVLAQTHAP